jgi:hypothetical protein
MMLTSPTPPLLSTEWKTQYGQQLAVELAPRLTKRFAKQFPKASDTDIAAIVGQTTPLAIQNTHRKIASNLALTGISFVSAGLAGAFKIKDKKMPWIGLLATGLLSSCINYIGCFLHDRKFNKAVLALVDQNPDLKQRLGLPAQ